jgi:membrane associated rhomboid family serine protease
MLPFDLFFFLLFIAVAIFQALFTHIPLGNENSNVRRLPWITFSIIILNVVIYLGTLPIVSKQEDELLSRRMELLEYLENNPALLYDKAVRKKLVDEGIVPEAQWTAFDTEMGRTEVMNEMFRDQLGETQVALLRTELDLKILEFKSSLESHLYYQLGLAPNGKWKFHQLITSLFMHGGFLHLLGNMIFFFAVGFSLEDRWGRGTFLGFYLLAGIAACLPSIISPLSVPLVGASGAISGAMGAFLIRLPKTRIKIGWAFMPFSIIGLLLVISRKLYGIVNIPSYIYIPYYFLVQVLIWWVLRKSGEVDGVAYSAHFAGAVFGIAFALLMKVSKVEEKFINTRIESKVAFNASPVVTEAFELMDKGEFALVERKLQAHLMVLPNDVGALMALIQVYQYTENFEQINFLYARVIRKHLSEGDKEAALYAYDSLLSSFPEDRISPKLPVRDWMMICQYVREMGMNREAAVEFERLAKTCPSDPLTARACLEGGETALTGNDEKLAMRLFEMALAMNLTDVFQSRARMGIEKCLALGVPQRAPKRSSQPGGVTDPTPEPKALH